MLLCGDWTTVVGRLGQLAQDTKDDGGRSWARRCFLLCSRRRLDVCIDYRSVVLIGRRRRRRRHHLIPPLSFFLSLLLPLPFGCLRLRLRRPTPVARCLCLCLPDAFPHARATPEQLNSCRTGEQLACRDITDDDYDDLTIDDGVQRGPEVELTAHSEPHWIRKD